MVNGTGEFDRARDSWEEEDLSGKDMGLGLLEITRSGILVFVPH